MVNMVLRERTDCWNCSDDFTQFQLVQNGCLACCIKTHLDRKIIKFFMLKHYHRVIPSVSLSQLSQNGWREDGIDEGYARISFLPKSPANRRDTWPPIVG